MEKYRIRKGIHKIGVMLLMLSFLTGMLSGCRQEQEGLTSMQDGTSNATGQNVMGRYMEEELSYTLDAIQAADLQILEDGKIALCDATEGMLILTEDGKTFENMHKEPFAIVTGDDTMEFIIDVAVKKDGSVSMVTLSTGDNEQDEESSTDTENKKQEENSTDTENNEQEENSTDTENNEQGEENTTAENAEDDATLESDTFAYDYHCYRMDRDGIISQIQLSGKSEEDIYKICYTEDGILCGADYAGNIYQIDDQTGVCTLLCQNDAIMEDFSGGRQKLYMLSDLNFMVYDFTDGSLKEETTVTDFLKEQYGDGNATIMFEADGGEVKVIQGDTEDSIYIASKGGLYRHVLDGTLMEQLIDGNLSILGDPSVQIADFIHTEDDQYIVVTKDGKLYTYHYDETVSSMPTEELQVYSLIENETVRQAITVFRKTHPDVYINYNFGLSMEGGMTIEDAIKNLSVDILSGNSPDILILDGLPIETYMNQQLLVDLAPYFTENADTTYFSNILNCYQKEGHLYAVPAKFKLALYAGDADMMGGATDFEELKEHLEKAREEKENGAILNIYTPEAMLTLLEKVDSAYWIKEDGTIDQERIESYLQQAKDLYDLEQQGISEEERTYFTEQLGGNETISQLGLLGKQMNEQIKLTGSFYGYMQEQADFSVGQVSNMQWDWSIVTSAMSQMKKGDFALWQNGAGKCFTPTAIASVCAGSSNVELSVNFVKTMLSTDTQKMENEDGLPVNQEALETLFVPEQRGDDTSYGALGLSYMDENGLEKQITLKCYAPEGTQKDKILSIIKSADTPSLNDIRIRNIVLEQGVDVLNGSSSAENAAKTICDKLNLYLSE